MIKGAFIGLGASIVVLMGFAILTPFGKVLGPGVELSFSGHSFVYPYTAILILSILCLPGLIGGSAVYVLAKAPLSIIAGLMGIMLGVYLHIQTMIYDVRVNMFESIIILILPIIFSVILTLIFNRLYRPQETNRDSFD